jgi:sRNA-binding carbon storage regulator CsrA
MLVLKRRLGETVRVTTRDGPVVLLVHRVWRDKVQFRIRRYGREETEKEVLLLAVGQYDFIHPEVEIQAVSIHGHFEQAEAGATNDVSVRIGFMAEKDISIDKTSGWVLSGDTPEAPVIVTFRDDDFTAADKALVLKYLSAVYQELGGRGLKAAEVRRLSPEEAEVPQ